ncbi:MAG: hypothetical protein ACWA5K_01045 [bacterium]
MNDKIAQLKEQERFWETSLGKWFPGERVVFRGKDLFKDLGDFTFTQMLYFAASGRIYEGDLLHFMSSANTVCTSYPDPRLWNNRVAALAGTVRSTPSLAASAATAASEAQTFGHGVIFKSSDLIRRAKIKTDNGESIGDFLETEIKHYRGLPGFGRPVTSKDERLEPILKKAKELGLGDGGHVQLLFEIQDYLDKTRRRLKLNISGLFTALMADIGITPTEFNLFFLFCFSGGIIGCHADALEHTEGSFFPFSVARINYSGQEARQWES